MKERNNWKETI